MTQVCGDSARFITTLKQEAIPGTIYYRLLEDFIVYSAILKRIIVCPAGMICDAESFKLKSSDEAGWIHDYLYRKDSITWHKDIITLSGINLNPSLQLKGVNRRIADKVFEEISVLDNVSAAFSWWKWATVRLLGHNCWHRYTVMQDISTKQ
jgi:hypothetical protein